MGDICNFITESMQHIIHGYMNSCKVEPDGVCHFNNANAIKSLLIYYEFYITVSIH